ncbi:MAG: hypothetical protein OEV15_07520 [Gallionella sp.]|nr:hypothetical protein [Gallionella sp.]
MKKFFAAITLVLLAACQSAPRLEDDALHVKLGRIVDMHEFTEVERKRAAASRPRDTKVGVGVSVGVDSGGTFGGLMLGMGSSVDDHSEEPPQIENGANRYIVEPQGSKELVEVMSYGRYNVGNCVKVLVDHPTAFPRFFDLKPGEHCD